MWLLNVRNRYFFLADALLVACIPFVAYALRLRSVDWAPYLYVLAAVAGVAVAIKIPIFWRFGLYNRYWRYASMDELLSILKGVGLATGVIALLQLAAGLSNWPPLIGFPRSF